MRNRNKGQTFNNRLQISDRHIHCIEYKGVKVVFWYGSVGQGWLYRALLSQKKCTMLLVCSCQNEWAQTGRHFGSGVVFSRKDLR